MTARMSRRQEHTACFLSNQRVEFSTTVTLFSPIDHYIYKPCATVILGTSRWDEKVHLSVYNTGPDEKTKQTVVTELKSTSYKCGKWLL